MRLTTVQCAFCHKGQAMDTRYVRPQTSHLLFQLFGRPLHPELFDVVACGRVRREEYEATVQITDAGHLVTWKSGSVCLCEVAAPDDHPLPRRRRLLSHRLRGERTDNLQYAVAVRYQVNLQVEKLEPAVFWDIHEELEIDGRRRGLFHQFGSPNRLSAGALSYVTLEAHSRLLLVQTFHTFPDEYALFKSQSLFELE